MNAASASRSPCHMFYYHLQPSTGRAIEFGLLQLSLMLLDWVFRLAYWLAADISLSTTGFFTGLLLLVR